MKVPSTGYSTWQCVTSGLHDLIRAQPTESTPAEIFKRAYCRKQLKSFTIALACPAFGAATLASLIKRASPLVSLSLGISFVATVWICKKWGDPSGSLARRLPGLVLIDDQDEANRIIDAGADIFRTERQLNVPRHLTLLNYAAINRRDTVVKHLLAIVQFSQQEMAYALAQAGSVETAKALILGLQGVGNLMTSPLCLQLHEIVTLTDENQIKEKVAVIKFLLEQGAVLGSEEDIPLNFFYWASIHPSVKGMSDIIKLLHPGVTE